MKPTSKDKNLGWIYAFIQFFYIAIIFIFGYFEQRIFKYSFIPLLEYIGITLIVISLLVMALAVLSFKQIITPNPVPMDKAKLITNGIYAYIRHPMYLFGILLMTGYSLYQNAYISLFLCVLLVLFFVVKIKFEERFLLQKFPAYSSYRTATKKLIPFIY